MPAATAARHLDHLRPGPVVSPSRLHIIHTQCPSFQARAARAASTLRDPAALASRLSSLPRPPPPTNAALLPVLFLLTCPASLPPLLA
ncbi:hypothetical protein Micbo1qcDRAFT_164465, partial [Microdochium bolleyi]